MKKASVAGASIDPDRFFHSRFRGPLALLHYSLGYGRDVAERLRSLILRVEAERLTVTTNFLDTLGDSIVWRQNLPMTRKDSRQYSRRILPPENPLKEPTEQEG